MNPPGTTPDDPCGAPKSAAPEAGSDLGEINVWKTVFTLGRLYEAALIHSEGAGAPGLEALADAADLIGQFRDRLYFRRPDGAVPDAGPHEGPAQGNSGSAT